jgi:hypothetical protein
MIMRKSVVLPAPLGPMTPTMPPRGRSNDQVAQRGARGDLDVGGFVAGVVLLAEHLFVTFKAGLVLGGPGLGVHADPFQLALEGLLALRFEFFFDREAGLFLLEPRGVVPLEGVAPAPVEFEDPPGDVVEEVAIVGDGDDGAAEIVKVAFEPGDRVGVEVVGGLVEQQHVGRAEHQLAHGDAAFFATREGADEGVARGETHGVAGHGEGAVEFPEVGGVDLILHAGLLGENFVHLLGGEIFPEPHVEFVVAVENSLGVGDRLLHALINGGVGVELGFLAKIANLDSLGGPGGPHEVGVVARHDAEQGALARAIGSQHANLRPGVERQPDIREHLLLLIDLGDLFHGEDVLLGHRQGSWEEGSRGERVTKGGGSWSRVNSQ